LDNKMNKIAIHIIAEAKESRSHYAVTGNSFDKIKANMYTVFECYAFGIIDWRQSRDRLKHVIKEYVNLYPKDRRNNEIQIMREEFNRMNTQYKPSLDAYKVAAEQKLTSTLITNQKLDESVAKHHSNIYYNSRTLTENDLKDISTLKTWKRVMEAYPNLTTQDEARVRMLTIFEGPTVDTTQMITTVMKEEPTAISGPMNTSMRPKARPAPIIDIGASPSGGTRGINPADNYSAADLKKLATGAVPSRAPATSMRPKERPAGLAQRSAINRAVGQAMGEAAETNELTHVKAMRKRGIKFDDALMLAKKMGIDAIVVKIVYGIDEESNELGSGKTTVEPNSNRAYLRKDILSRNDRLSHQANAIPEPGERAKAGLGSQFQAQAKPSVKIPKSLLQALLMSLVPTKMGDGEMQPDLIARLKDLDTLKDKRRPSDNIDEGSIAGTVRRVKDMIANGASKMDIKRMFPHMSDDTIAGFFERFGQNEGYKVLPPMDKEKYQARDGLEGPFSTLSGKVVYYDPKEGSYYDPDTDMYISYDDFQALDKDYSGMSEEMNDDEVNAFHTALDSLVHKHLGHSSDEVDEAKTKPGHNMRAQQRLRSIMDKAIAASKAKRGIDDEDEDIDRTDETMSGSIGTIAMPMGKMRKRNKDTIFASKESKDLKEV
jgi:hypothetical protein